MNLPTDQSSQKIMRYLVDQSFNSVHVLSCVADIARAIGHNPRTVSNRMQQLIDTNAIKVVDSYPREGRTMVAVYQINRPAASHIINPNVEA
jgi:predicted ArsR family transcriptional regulator